MNTETGYKFQLPPEQFITATLRDQFAMAALTGVLSSLNPPSQAGKICYEYADQMLAAR